ncbi:MAG: flotillin-like protein FloA [Bradymonadales bacterium]|nr:flotillin-like protein FloA [Bradymonadales bacterium]
MDLDLTLILTIAVIVAAVILFFYLVPVRLFIAAWSSGAKVGIFDLIAMRLRRVPPAAIVNGRISAIKAGIDLKTSDLEAHFLAGGNVSRVVAALISANRAALDLSFLRAAAIDLAGRDVLSAVQMSVNPKVIETPRVSAMAKDGIQLLAISRITVRTNLEKLVGGAGEDTIIARVGEGIVTTIGSSTDHKAVLENPDKISKTVLNKGLDVGTAFEILSVDIADVDVGENIGAKLQAEQAEADKRVAQARAEGRRAMAVAQEQEMRALLEEMRAKLVEAEAQVPKALAEALRSGNMGFMDYYQYRNIVADTDMRSSFAQPGKEPEKGGERKP